MIVINIQKLEKCHSSFCVTALYTHILKVYDIAIKGLKNENKLFAQYCRRKRLFAKGTTMF